MFTRGRRKKGEAETSCRTLSVEEAADLNETPKNKEITVSPTAHMKLEELRAQLEIERNKNIMLETMVKNLQEDKEFLKQQLGRSGTETEMTANSEAEAEVSTSPTLLQSSSSESSSEEEKIVKKKKSMKKRKVTPACNRTRAKHVQAVIRRYKAALKQYRRGNSMRRAFEKVGVDRNTISRTAPIAELYLVAPDVFNSLPPWNEKQCKLSEFAAQCHKSMTQEIMETIKSKKCRSELLPIVYKTT